MHLLRHYRFVEGTSLGRRIRELIAYSRANPDKVNYGSSGTGSINHLAGELLQSMTGIRWEIGSIPTSLAWIDLRR